jgi:hypothetical protein
MSDEEQQHAPTHKKATKVGGMRVGQDKAHHHASSEQQQLKSTARSTVADSTPHPLTTTILLPWEPVQLHVASAS